MKRYVSAILFLLITTLISYLAYKIYKTVAVKNQTAQKIAVLPRFKFYKQDMSVFTNDSLNESNNRIIIQYFSPDCEHCRQMTQKYLREKNRLGNSTILMITHSDSSSTASFYNTYTLSALSNLVVLRDTAFQFHKLFGPTATPSFFVYKNNVLINRFSGETLINNLLSDTLIRY